jgi:signal transduction histidine kinase
MKDELNKGNINEVNSIANHLLENEDKISHHGKRADAIVKGMLQHSRATTGQREPTDINALADEYLRLAYHGYRAKNKDFNAELITDFDPSISKQSIVQQDIGRVFLNMYNNAFYAVYEKLKLKGNSYRPKVSVSTKKTDNKIVVRFNDNGVGIPEKIRDKIFQPFFTSKPAGEGTGLGLSLSYDIIKAHGGELLIDSKPNEGAEFIVELPLNA